MNVFCEKEQNCTVVIIDGDLSVPNTETFKNFLLNRIKEGITQVLIDFSDVSYIDSSGISVLLSLLQAARKHGGDIRLSNTNNYVRDVLRQVGLHHVFRRFDNRETGIASFCP